MNILSNLVNTNPVTQQFGGINSSGNVNCGGILSGISGNNQSIIPNNSMTSNLDALHKQMFSFTAGQSNIPSQIGGAVSSIGSGQGSGQNSIGGAAGNILGTGSNILSSP